MAKRKTLEEFVTAQDEACVRKRFGGSLPEYLRELDALCAAAEIPAVYVKHCTIDPVAYPIRLHHAQLLVQLWQPDDVKAHQFRNLLLKAGTIPDDTTLKTLRKPPKPPAKKAPPRRAAVLNPADIPKIPKDRIDDLVKMAAAVYDEMLKEKKYDHEQARGIATALLNDMIEPYRLTHPNLPLMVEAASNGIVDSRTAEKWLNGTLVDLDSLAVQRADKAKGPGHFKPCAATTLASALIEDKATAETVAHYLCGIPWQEKKNARELIAMLDDIDLSVSDFMRIARYQQHENVREYSQKSLRIKPHAYNCIVSAANHPYAIPNDRVLNQVAERLCGEPLVGAEALKAPEKAVYRKLVYGSPRDAGEKLEELVKSMKPPGALGGMERTLMFNAIFRLIMERDGLRDRFALRDAIIEHNGMGKHVAQSLYSAICSTAGPEKLANNPDDYMLRRFSMTINSELATPIAAYAFPGDKDANPELRNKLNTLFTTPAPRAVRSATPYTALLAQEPDAGGPTPA